MTTPLLNLYAAGKRGLDPTVLDALRNADRYHVALGTEQPPYYALHFDFQNWPMYSVVTGVEDTRATPWRSPDTGRDFFVAACRLTRYFLDSVLRDDAAAAAYVRGEVPLPHLDGDLVSYRANGAVADER